jgi:hypothetical protein
MSTILRLVGLINAAIWLGGGVFFTVVAAPAVFQPEMKRLFQDYYTGVIAQFLQERYFTFQLVCGAVALAHTLVEWMAVGRLRNLLRPVLLAILYTITLLGTFWFVPHLEDLHKARHTAATIEARNHAGASFRAWHGLSQGLNLVMLGGLAIYLLNLAGRSSQPLGETGPSYSHGLLAAARPFRRPPS